MSTITIYLAQHRAACTEDADDLRAYDESINEYLDWLKSAAEQEGFTLETVDSGYGPSYSVDDDSNEAHQFMMNTADFWQWYN